MIVLSADLAVGLCGQLTLSRQMKVDTTGTATLCLQRYHGLSLWLPVLKRDGLLITDIDTDVAAITLLGIDAVGTRLMGHPDGLLGT
jgi:hypothetical protein